MLMLFDICENINLIDRTFLKFFIFFKSTNFNNFDCILFRIEFICCSVDFSISSLSNYLVQGVIFDDSNHFVN